LRTIITAIAAKIKLAILESAQREQEEQAPARDHKISNGDPQ
jgi:hypothetical protein